MFFICRCLHPGLRGLSAANENNTFLFASLAKPRRGGISATLRRAVNAFLNLFAIARYIENPTYFVLPLVSTLAGNNYLDSEVILKIDFCLLTPLLILLSAEIDLPLLILNNQNTG